MKLLGKVLIFIGILFWVFITCFLLSVEFGTSWAVGFLVLLALIPLTWDGSPIKKSEQEENPEDISFGYRAIQSPVIEEVNADACHRVECVSTGYRDTSDVLFGASLERQPRQESTGRTPNEAVRRAE